MPSTATPTMLSATCKAPTNIAVIKYWGKENVVLNTPLNSSISLTLSMDTLHTKTTVAASRDFTSNRIWLNGVEEPWSSRLDNVLSQCIAISSNPSKWQENMHFHIVSYNTFPTAAGLASSASGYACLVSTLSSLLECKEEFPHQLTTIARVGSGSASRSLYGGLVKWSSSASSKRRPDGSDSYATQLLDEDHWPELNAVILVSNAQEKETPSTVGMKRSKVTSAFLAHRASNVVTRDLLNSLTAAYATRDFEKFGRIIMRDSNNFHATCVDTYPPIFYLNETSRRIIAIVHAFNNVNGVRAAYTFDAGPNAVVFIQEKDVAEFMSLVLSYFPPTLLQRARGFVKGKSSYSDYSTTSSPYSELKFKASYGAISTVYHTAIGEGPVTLSDKHSLINLETGLPLKEKCNLESFGMAAALGGVAAIATFVTAALIKKKH